MFAIMQTTFSKLFSGTKTVIFIQISLEFIPNGINKSVLVRSVAWRRTGDAPLLKPVAD